MDAKFQTGLYEGDNANGVKLSMGLTGGDFWARIGGCRNTYRGKGDGRAEEIDFKNVLAVSDIESNAVGVSGVVHEAGKSYLYAVRSVNCAGDEEHGLNGLTKISFDENGNLIAKNCNFVSDIKIERQDDLRVRILWRYSPVNELADCEKFCLYSNGGERDIDYCNVIEYITYKRQRIFCFESEKLKLGKWKFCIGAVSSDGYERLSSEIAIEVDSKSTDGGDIQANVI